MEASISPPNSVIFIADATAEVEVPEYGDGLVAASSTCVMVGTLAEMDGPTTIRLSDRSEAPLGELAFEGLVRTPSRIIAVTTAHLDTILSMPTSSEVTAVSIWVNDPGEPDEIIIRASAP